MEPALVSRFCLIYLWKALCKSKGEFKLPQWVNPNIRYGSAKMAADVEIERIVHYMCDLGPAYCVRCPSKCAYGIRYIKECIPKQK